ncbi:MAG: PilT/PilU family type 4a pilus ATPase [Halioglobus sp.]|nr:PilT/PilU family type 4a pilus ATPase [Halioglobus sp.]
MKITNWLKILSAEQGSDLYLSTGAPPCAMFEGQLRPIGNEILQPGEIREIAYEIMDETQRAEFERELDMNLALSVSGYGRFRINMFMQRNEVGIVARNIVAAIPDWETLRLPAVLAELVMRKRGLILVAGPTGSGKSTSMAALIDHRNSNSGGHIVTIEDPVEYVHSHKKSIVNQREVGVDTRNWHSALKNVMRQAPDVVFIGEIRDRETMEHALSLAETGHLCISTLPSANVGQTLERIINLFPEYQRPQLLMDLAQNLQCIAAQRLVPATDGQRCLAVELLLSPPEVQELIARGDVGALKDVMDRSHNLGMKSFDYALFELYQSGLITEQEALRSADSASNVRLQISYDQETGDGDAGPFGPVIEAPGEHDEPPLLN